MPSARDDERGATPARLGRHAVLDTRRLEEAREAVRENLEEVREIARRLRPEALDDLGLGSALALSPSCVQIHVRGCVFDTTFLLG